MKSIFEEMDGTYHLAGDPYLPPLRYWLKRKSLAIFGDSDIDDTSNSADLR